MTAYALALGSLLLLGGRLADLYGRKVTFMASLAGFAGVSAVGGHDQVIAPIIAGIPQPPPRPQLPALDPRRP